MSDQPAGQPPPIRSFASRASDLRWLGEPQGDGLGLLKAELTGILRDEGNARRAWLTRVQYAGEERVRIAVVIDGGASGEEMVRTIGPACQELVDIDILFFERMPARHVSYFQDLPPFYEAVDG